MFDKNRNQQALAWAKKITALRLLGGKCSCGASDPLVLDFHHDDKDKEVNVSRLRHSRLTTMKREVFKCTVVCANCHGEIHSSECKNSDPRKRMLKEKLLEIKGQSRCILCGYDKACSLEFHHARDKKFDISTYIFNRLDIPWESVLEEINKCKILCKNCHRIEHLKESFEKLYSLIEKKIFEHKEQQDPADRNEVLRLYTMGVPQIQIARNLGYCKATISLIIKKFR